MDSSSEDVLHHYKATLVLLAKRRKIYPPVLARRLGYSVRQERYALEAMKVDINPVSVIEEQERSKISDMLDENWNLSTNIKATLNEMEKTNSYMNKLSEAFKIMTANESSAEHSIHLPN